MITSADLELDKSYSAGFSVPDERRICKIGEGFVVFQPVLVDHSFDCARIVGCKCKGRQYGDPQTVPTFKFLLWANGKNV